MCRLQIDIRLSLHGLPPPAVRRLYVPDSLAVSLYRLCSQFTHAFIYLLPLCKSRRKSCCRACRAAEIQCILIIILFHIPCDKACHHGIAGSYGVQHLSAAHSRSVRINVKIKAGEETEINGQGTIADEDDLKMLAEKLQKLVLKGRAPISERPGAVLPSISRGRPLNSKKTVRIPAALASEMWSSLITSTLPCSISTLITSALLFCWSLFFLYVMI